MSSERAACANSIISNLMPNNNIYLIVASMWMV